jgi:glutamine amidotransferase
MVTIVDYGIGNIQALRHIYQMLGLPVAVASRSGDILSAERLILPGVGAFDWAMERLEGSGLRDALDARVLVDRIPVLGICVGMQMMAMRSEEGVSRGLSWLDAEVRDLHAEEAVRNLPLPHMGWNDALPVRESPLFKGLKDPRFYFLHSYRFCPNDDVQTVAVTDYGIGFCAAVSRDNVFGVQFHPEKSHDWGVQLLKNFAEI